MENAQKDAFQENAQKDAYQENAQKDASLVSLSNELDICKVRLTFHCRALIIILC